MSNFEYYLQDIAASIRSPNNSVYRGDFIAVKNHVLDIMREEDYFFEQICQNDILFGSKAHDIRIFDDDEFDVLMELRFPDEIGFDQFDDEHRPGFVFLDFSDACSDELVSNRLITVHNSYEFLSRKGLQRWLHNIFKNALINYGNMVYGVYEEYTLSYKWRGITYTITAESQSRIFHIDFVPAVKMDWSNSDTWHAVPKTMCGPKSSGAYTFMLANSQRELHHVNRCGQTLKEALRLLQALRNSKKLYKLRCYYFVTAAIWLARRLGSSNVSNMPLSELFLTLLSDLCDAFCDDHLPYVWNSKMNLLYTFSSNELSHYGMSLCAAYNKLVTYPHQQKLSFARCLSHFE